MLSVIRVSAIAFAVSLSLGALSLPKRFHNPSVNRLHLERRDRWTVDTLPLVRVGDGNRAVMNRFAGSVGATRVGNLLVVGDYGSNVARVFNLSGRYLRTIARDSILYLKRILKCPDNSVILHDSHASIVRRFDTLGRYRGNMRVTRAVGSGQLIACERAAMVFVARPRAVPREGLARLPVSLFRVRTDAGKVDTLGVFGEDELYFSTRYGSWIERPFGARTHIASGPRHFYVVLGGSAEIAVYARTGQLVRRIGFDIMSRAPNDDDVRAAAIHLLTLELDPRDVALSRLLLSEVPLPSRLPVIDRLMVDPDENVWVRRHTMLPRALRWTVYDSAGRLLADIADPTGFRIAEVGRDYVLGFAASADGYQALEVRRLRKGG